ncbi:putative protein FAM90A9 [Equus asinus]|uniref:putative protein FAM90A9 n=1 Tax=Equus asinus TaxID=9793 RepID=UPI001D03D380|nr:putative protein FAM90A9P [Equus asinus]
MADPSTRHWPSSLLKAQKRKKQPKGAAGPRVPPAEEEDPRVKCKDCGAFGHHARSLRCPMKRWHGALAPQPLGSRKLKENLEPRPQQVPPIPRPSSQAEREREQRQRQDEQRRKALVQRFPRRPQGRQQPSWKEGTESCDYVRHANRPLPVHTTKRETEPGLELLWRLPVRTPDRTSTGCAGSAIQSPGVSLFSPRGLEHGREVSVPPSPPRASPHWAQDPTVMVQLRDETPSWLSPEEPQAACKTQGLGHTPDTQAQARSLDVQSHPCQQPAAHLWDRHCKISIQAAGKRGPRLPIHTGQNLPKKPRLGRCQSPQRSPQRPHQGLVQTLQPPPCSADEAPQVARKAPRDLQGSGLQPGHNTPPLSAVQPCTVPHRPPLHHVPGQPLRMLFTRSDKGWWSSRFLTAPSFHPAEKTSRPVESPPILQKSEGQRSLVPPSVLYEDLQVSSSSEESVWEGDTSWP